MVQDSRYRFVAAGRSFHDGAGIAGPGTACQVAREAARRTPGVEHTVQHTKDGSLLAAYTYSARTGTLKVRMP